MTSRNAIFFGLNGNKWERAGTFVVNLIKRDKLEGAYMSAKGLSKDKLRRAVVELSHRRAVLDGYGMEAANKAAKLAEELMEQGYSRYRSIMYAIELIEQSGYVKEFRYVN